MAEVFGFPSFSGPTPVPYRKRNDAERLARAEAKRARKNALRRALGVVELVHP